MSAKKRGIRCTIFSFTEVDEKLGKVVSYKLDEDELRKIWTPKIIMVVDHSHTLMGSVQSVEQSKAIFRSFCLWSSHARAHAGKPPTASCAPGSRFCSMHEERRERLMGARTAPSIVSTRLRRWLLGERQPRGR